MARITNYGELKQAVAIRMHRTLVGDLDAVIDSFQGNVEGTLTLMLNSWHNSQQLVLTDTDRDFEFGNNSYFLPGNFWGVLEVIKNTNDTTSYYAEYFGWGDDAYVQKPITANQGVNEIRNGLSTPVQGYSISPDSNLIRFNKVPPEGTIFSLYYTLGVQPLLLDADTSRLLNWNPNVYIYGLCSEIASYVQDMELEAYYRERFGTEIERVNERGVKMDNRGPAQIQGASQWV